MWTVVLAIGFFAACFLLMGIGFLITGAVLRGSCGGAAAFLGKDGSCGACGKKARDLCPSDDETGLLKIGNLSNPHRPLDERDADPGVRV